MSGQGKGGAQALTEEHQELIRRSHHRLRKASQELEALVAPRLMRGRWEPVSAPPEVVETVRSELSAAYREVERLQKDLLGTAPPTEVGGPDEPA